MRTAHAAWLWLLTLLAVPAAHAAEPGELRLIPFPKECRLTPGTFGLERRLTLAAPAAQQETLGQLVNDELRRAGFAPAEVRTLGSAETAFCLSAAAGEPALPGIDADTSGERYALDVKPEAITARGASSNGLVYAMQTVCQLIRANRRDGGIPCLAIRDWPALRWRAFQDDMTRGPSSALETLRFEAATAAGLKLNLMTYYMEYQFAFKKHPAIGPADGSLTADELAALVAFAKPLGMDVLGNQQSFGHFSRILAKPEYTHLREGADVLNPLKEETYELLDDMYSEVCPVLPFPFFNACCDETWELGKGPTKELAEKIGVGGVYVRHIRRVHDLLTEKHKKRMMMWGDIILQHPDRLAEIPKDTIMLTWGYDARENFESQIVPFARSGYEFFVCPGVSNWSRILPDFKVATTNIAHFVRDGAKHGALGMINTDWEDDGEALNGVKWYCDAWAAECAWNASATALEDFNRRVGAVLFGEPGDRFGRAVTLLAKAHAMPGMQGMNNHRFWQSDFLPQAPAETVEVQARALLEAVEPAIAELEALESEAVMNRHVLDVYLFGARRMELIGRRMLDGLEAARLYSEAAAGPLTAAPAKLTEIEQIITRNRDVHEATGRRFAELWRAESKPYALDWTMARYGKAVADFDALLARVRAAREQAEAGQAMPPPETIGLALPR